MSPFTRTGLDALAARTQLAERACHMTEGHPPHTWVAAPPQVPNPPFLWCLGKPCPDGRHRPDDDPTPGDRCKDCGRELTWRGPGPYDWDLAEPVTDVDGIVAPMPDAAAVLREKRERAAASDAATRCPWCDGHPSPCADHRPEPAPDAEPEASRYWLGTCPKDGVHIGLKTEGSDPDVPLVMRARDSVDSTCLCGTALTLRLVARAEYEDVLGPDDDDENEPDDEDGPERTATELLAYLLTQYERAVDIHAQVRMDTDEDRRLHADAVAALRDAADPIARFLARAELPADEPDDGGPFRPRWPLLVSEDTKRNLLVQLAEVVHAPEPTGSDPRAAADWGTFRRGVEYGMAKVMLALGINEAGSPERASLPAPDDATNQPPDPAPDVHLPGDEFTPECGAAPDASTRLTVDPHLVTCPTCLTILREDAR